MNPASPPIKTLFVHVPKCGGTTVWMFLGEIYPFVRCAYAVGRGIFNKSIDTSDLYNQNYNNTLDKIDYITGHFERDAISAWSAGRAFEDYSVITALRDPLSRASSMYRYGCENPDLVRTNWFREVSFTQYIRSIVDDPQMHNEMARIVTGTTDPAAAVEILQRDYTAAVPIGDVGQFLREYRRLLGGRRGDPDRIENQTRLAPPTWETVEPSLTHDFLAVSAADEAIYAWSLENWRGHMERSLSRRLAPGSQPSEAPRPMLE
jgi:hypothetical protein